MLISNVEKLESHDMSRIKTVSKVVIWQKRSPLGILTYVFVSALFFDLFKVASCNEVNITIKK